MSDRETCRQFREGLAEGRESSPIHQGFLEHHAGACPECAAFRRRLADLDRVAARAAAEFAPPGPEARARLRASWEHLALRKSWWDRASYWYETVIAPQVVRPLVPHAAVILGFIFFTWSLVMVQTQTGLLTVHIDRAPSEQVVSQAPRQAPYQDANIVSWHG